MNTNQVSKIMSAIEAAEIKEYKVTSTTGYHLQNNPSSGVVIEDDANEMLHNIRAKSKAYGAEPFAGNAVVESLDYADISEFTIGGGFKAIKEFFSNMGVTLTKEQQEMLLKIDRSNYQIIPETGNYHPFKPVSQEEYDAMTEEEKAAYDAAKKDDEARRTGINQGRAIRITC